MQHYSSREVSDLTGTSYRQVDYWANNGVVHPGGNAEGSGRNRSWAAADVIVVKIAAELRQVGVSLGRLQAFYPVSAKAADLVMQAPMDECFLFVSNDTVGIVHSQTDVQKLFASQHNPVVVVVVLDVRRLAESMFLGSDVGNTARTKTLGQVITGM